MSVTTDRQDTIRRAVVLMDHTYLPELSCILARADIGGSPANPVVLRDQLAAALTKPGSPGHFSAWEAAQKILQAAGPPY
jgi:hypothetical protein